MNTKKQNTQAIRTLAGTAVLAALIIVLSFVSKAISGVLMVNITLSLIPIIVGAILFGPVSGAVLGAVMGLVVVYTTVTGGSLDLAFVMFQYNPILTVALCIIKSTAAGALSGLIWRLLENKLPSLVNSLITSVACPICNTTLFCIPLVLFYREPLYAWADKVGLEVANLFVFVISIILGVNFVIEFLISLIFSPAIVRIINAVKKQLR